MNEAMKLLAEQIQDALAKRAKFVSENAQHLAPFGQRSAALQLMDAKLYLEMIAELQKSGQKTTADEREAMLEKIKAENSQRNVLEQTMLKTNEMLALMDAEIEFLRRCFEAYKVS